MATIFNGATEYLPSSLSLSATELSSGSGSVSLLLAGQQSGKGSLSWSGLNNQGQAVSSGVYYFSAQFTDPFGRVTVLNQAVDVLQPAGQTTVSVFNSAGELVYSQDLSEVAPNAVSFSESGNAFSPSNDPSQGMNFKITKAGGQSVIWTWNGRNSQGQIVDSGVYLVQLTSNNGPGASVNLTESVTVIKGPGAQLSANPILGPNPVFSGNSLFLSYSPQSGYEAVGKLRDLTGELVTQADDPGSSGRMQFDLSHAAAGIYFVEFDLMQGPMVAQRQILKAAVAR